MISGSPPVWTQRKQDIDSSRKYSSKIEPSTEGGPPVWFWINLIPLVKITSWLYQSNVPNLLGLSSWTPWSWQVTNFEFDTFKPLMDFALISTKEAIAIS